LPERAFYCNTYEKAPRFDGLTFRNASHALAGGAVNGNAQSHGGLTVADCLFSNNVTAAGGGALWLAAAWNYSGVLTNCTFVANQGRNGGAVFVQRGNMAFGNNMFLYDSDFVGNTATRRWAATATGAAFTSSAVGTSRATSS
jgi:hypothetical protein